MNYKIGSPTLPATTTLPFWERQPTASDKLREVVKLLEEVAEEIQQDSREELVDAIAYALLLAIVGAQHERV